MPSITRCRTGPRCGSRSHPRPARSTTRPTTATGSNGRRLMPDAAHLDQPGELRRRDEPAGVPCTASRCARSSATRRANRRYPGSRRLHQRQRKARFAGARGPADQHGARTDENGGGMDRGGMPDRGSPRITSPAGARRSGRRGPAARRRRPASEAMRFSAQMRPPCASTICLEIDRPRPEFWPKPCSGRSV